jgi:hypothetical protein
MQRPQALRPPPHLRQSIGGLTNRRAESLQLNPALIALAKPKLQQIVMRARDPRDHQVFADYAELHRPNRCCERRLGSDG